MKLTPWFSMDVAPIYPGVYMVDQSWPDQEKDDPMRCPKCQKEGKTQVLESRPYDGQVWRRRMCQKCLKTFVSCETASPDMKMPAQTQSKHRLKDRKIKPEQHNLRWGSK